MDIECGDYTLTPSGRLGGMVSVSQEGKHLGEFAETESALKFVSERMEQEQFYTNIWWISDHGNGWMIDKDGNELPDGDDDDDEYYGANDPMEDEWDHGSMEDGWD